MPRLPGFRRASDGESPSPAPPAATARTVRRALPPAGQLRRERRVLLQLREERLRDLGGLMLEMYRRDQFRQDLLVERCAELVTLEERLARARRAARRSRVARPRASGRRCECGAPIFWGSNFCAQCGRRDRLAGRSDGRRRLMGGARDSARLLPDLRCGVRAAPGVLPRVRHAPPDEPRRRRRPRRRVAATHPVVSGRLDLAGALLPRARPSSRPRQPSRPRSNGTNAAGSTIVATSTPVPVGPA